MAKKDSMTFVCENCGSSYPTWYGKCPECHEWNTLKEFREGKGDSLKGDSFNKPAEFKSLDQYEKTGKDDERLSSGLGEMDRVLGGGFLRDEVVLVSGEPGVGKSTLLMSVLAHQTLGAENQVAYISSEEGGHQVEERCRRLGIKTQDILFSSGKEIASVLSSLETLITQKPIKMLVFDSLQGLYTNDSTGLPGSMSQSKEALLKIVEFAKAHSVVALVVGHITKEGEIAGPKFLEHMVDCVLFMEGERTSNLRMLRAFKNRFGPTEEVGFFAMSEKGMQEVKNPSEFFLDWQSHAVGKASIAVRQGVRVVFATVESLMVSSSLAFPKRVAKGVDAKRLELILAILKKYLKLPVDKFDIYVNVSGGLQVKDTLADFGVAIALYSSLTGKTFDPKELYLGELGLLGNIRTTNSLNLVSKEATRLGFTKVYSGKNVPSIFKLTSL